MTGRPASPLLPLLLRRVAPGLWSLPQIPDDASDQLIGWRLLEIDLGGISDKEQTLIALGQAGSFPDHYGHNWDAAYDCLTDLDLDAVLVRTVSGLDQAVASTLHGILVDAVDYWLARGRSAYIMWEGTSTSPQLPAVR